MTPIKSNISFEVEFLAGTSLEDALEEASVKAYLWGVAYVKFNFNGIRISVRPAASEMQIKHALEQYNIVLQEDSKIKFLIC